LAVSNQVVLTADSLQAVLEVAAVAQVQAREAVEQGQQVQCKVLMVEHHRVALMAVLVAEVLVLLVLL
jgi:hypothetical protein